MGGTLKKAGGEEVDNPVKTDTVGRNGVGDVLVLKEVSGRHALAYPTG